MSFLSKIVKPPKKGGFLNKLVKFIPAVAAVNVAKRALKKRR